MGLLSSVIAYGSSPIRKYYYPSLIGDLYFKLHNLTIKNYGSYDSFIWKVFREQLDKSEKKSFDEMMSITRLYNVASVDAFLYENGTCTNENLEEASEQIINTNGTVDDFLKSLPSDNTILAQIVCQDNSNETTIE